MALLISLTSVLPGLATLGRDTARSAPVYLAEGDDDDPPICEYLDPNNYFCL